MKRLILTRKSENQKRKLFSWSSFIIFGIIASLLSCTLVPNNNAWAWTQYKDLPKCEGGWKIENAKENRTNADANNPQGYLQSYIAEVTCAATGETVKEVVIPANDFPKEYGNGVSCFIIEQSTGGRAPYCVGGDVPSLSPGGITQEEWQEAIESAANNEEYACYRQAGALGWLVCPIIEGIGGALSTIYENIITPFLTIEPALVSNSSTNGTYIAWNIFRTIANWVFVILLLAVIFSQITGIGIDNYGIKKILPKLIVAAILINLSYIICQLAVDLSNILGSGLNSLFTSIASQIDSEASSSTAYISGLVGTVSAALGIVAGIAAAGAATFAVVSIASGGWAVVAPILLTFVSALLSVLFMFATLFIRQALAVLLVAVAPLAFASYILPNTKRVFFDRWLNIFKGILLLYPLAGALIGGGLLASVTVVTASSSALANSEGSELQLIFTYLGGIALQVIPFFFLPTLFRNSINAVNNIGNTLSGLGRSLGSGLNKTVSGSESYQAMQARLAAGRPGGWRDRIARSTGLGKNGIARNRMKYDRMMSRQGAYDAMFGEDYLLKTQTENEMRRITSSGEFNNVGYDKDSGSITRGNNLAWGLQEALEKNDTVKIRAYSDALAMKGGFGRMAMKAAYNAANASGNLTDEAARTWGNNIMNSNYASSFKADARSLYETASKAQQGARQDTHAVQSGDLAKEASASTMVSMDDDEFEQTFQTDWEANLTPNQVRAIRRNAWQAIQQNPNANSKRYNQLREIARGFVPDDEDLQQVRVVP